VLRFKVQRERAEDRGDVPVEVITTKVSSQHRTITLLLDSGETARYALIRRPTGQVAWFYDTFRPEVGGGPLQWASHGGRVTVGEVLALVPAARRDILRWTDEELEDGADLIELDIFARDVRAKWLAQLAAERADVERFVQP
jgi:hypothetical protein